MSNRIGEDSLGCHAIAFERLTLIIIETVIADQNCVQYAFTLHLYLFVVMCPIVIPALVAQGFTVVASIVGIVFIPMCLLVHCLNDHKADEDKMNINSNIIIIIII